MQNNLPDGPVLSPQLLTSPKAMELSWAQLCPVSRCQMSDGMDGRDSFAEAQDCLKKEKKAGSFGKTFYFTLFLSSPTGKFAEGNNKIIHTVL